MVRLAVALVVALLAVTLSAAPVSGQTPTCVSASSDPDGDGWGWENGATCRVDEQQVSAPSSSASQTPTCASASSDPDGDGWGWENGATCRVAVQQVSAPTVTPSTPSSSASQTPTCASASSDPDGDGWGWENGATCRVGEQKTDESSPDALAAVAGEGLSITSPAEGTTVRADADGQIEIEAAISFTGGQEIEGPPIREEQDLPTNVYVIALLDQIGNQYRCSGFRPQAQCAWDAIEDTLHEMVRLNNEGVANYRVKVASVQNQVPTEDTDEYVDPVTALQELGDRPPLGLSVADAEVALAVAVRDIRSERGAKQIVVFGHPWWLREYTGAGNLGPDVDPGISVDWRVLAGSGGCAAGSLAAELTTAPGTCSTHGDAGALLPTFVTPETQTIIRPGGGTGEFTADYRVQYFHRELGATDWRSQGTVVTFGESGDLFDRDLALPDGTHEIQLRAVRWQVVNGQLVPDPAASEFVSPIRTITVVGSNVANATPSDFREWLLGLSSDQIATQLRFSNAGAARVGLPVVGDSFGFNDFRVRIPINPFAVRGSVQSLDGFITTGGGGANSEIDVVQGFDVGVVRNTDGVVTDFVEPDVSTQFDRSIEQLGSFERGTLDQFVAFTRGCFASAAEFAALIKTVFLESWGNIDFAYLAGAIPQILEIRDAFLADPVAFFQQFLQQILRVEEYENDRAQWAGLIVCDLAIGLVTGGAAGVVGKLLQRMPEVRAFSPSSDRGADSSPLDSCLFGGESGLEQLDPQNGADRSIARVVCRSNANRGFDEVDTRFAGSTPFTIGSSPSAFLVGGGNIIRATGEIAQGHNRRSDFEKSYPAPRELGLPSNQYDRSHLVGVGGTGTEAGQILYATRNFNRSFQKIVEGQMQRGYKIALARGWKLKYEVTATTHPRELFQGAVLRNISYEVFFETDAGDRVKFMSADGAQSAPDGFTAGETTRDFIFVEPEFR